MKFSATKVHSAKQIRESRKFQWPACQTTDRTLPSHFSWKAHLRLRQLKFVRRGHHNEITISAGQRRVGNNIGVLILQN